VSEKGSRVAVVDEYGPVSVAAELEHMPWVSASRAATDVTLLIVYATVIVCFTLAFALVGFYEYDT
jgi:hypothetical protein